MEGHRISLNIKVPSIDKEDSIWQKNMTSSFSEGEPAAM